MILKDKNQSIILFPTYNSIFQLCVHPFFLPKLLKSNLIVSLFSLDEANKVTELLNLLNCWDWQQFLHEQSCFNNLSGPDLLWT